MAARHMFATRGFVHLDRKFRKGDEVPFDDPMVVLRPDLFSQDPPAKRTKAPPPPPVEPGEIVDVAPVDAAPVELDEESDSPS